MKEAILKIILPQLINALILAFPEKTIKKALDSAIDAIENQIAKSETQVDDMALPVIKVIRSMFDIPDLPDNILE